MDRNAWPTSDRIVPHSDPDANLWHIGRSLPKFVSNRVITLSRSNRLSAAVAWPDVLPLTLASQEYDPSQVHPGRAVLVRKHDPRRWGQGALTMIRSYIAGGQP